MKEYFDHYSGLKAAKDGEIFVPMTNGHSGHFTYGHKKPKGHKIVKYKGIFYPVHRIIAEVFLNNNKPIPEGYDVHHINHIPDDNRPENLIILTHGEHAKLHNTGKNLSEETRKKISETHKGERHPNWGKFGSEHPRSKPVIGVHKETGEEVKFGSTREAQRVLGINQSSISACCLGKVNHAGNYKWHYA